MMHQMISSIKQLSMLLVSRVVTQVGRSMNENNATATKVGGSVCNDEREKDEDTERNEGCIPYQATLKRCPRSLFVFWQEFKVGIVGQKPDSLFSQESDQRIIGSCRQAVFKSEYTPCHLFLRINFTEGGLNFLPKAK